MVCQGLEDTECTNITINSKKIGLNELKNINIIINERFEKFNTTIVVISHSLKSISWADSIIVVADGGISASGTHKELLGTCGWYSESWKTEVE